MEDHYDPLTPELSRDSVDALRKKVEGRQKKIESAKNGQKPGWELEVDKQIAGKYRVCTDI